MDKMILYMKKVVFFLMLLLPFVSCDKNAEGVLKAELSISKNEIVLDSDASVEELVVKANTDWSINDIPDWCGTIRPSYGRAGEWTVRIRGRFYEGKENRTAELKVVAEIDGSISDLLSYARLYAAGMNFTYNPNRLILNKVTDCYLVKNGERVEIEDDKLYCVISDLSSAQMLGSVTDMSFGLLKIIPKFEDGTPVENYEDLIVTRDGKEVKAWAAIAEYMTSFEDTDGDGLGEVPEKYGTQEGRKVVEDSKKLGDLLKNPNNISKNTTGKHDNTPKNNNLNNSPKGSLLVSFLYT